MAEAGDTPEPSVSAVRPVGEEMPGERAGREPVPGNGSGPDRAEVLAMLARYGDRSVDQVGEELGSLELTWLVDQIERRYGVLLELTDEVFAEMTTVTGAVRVLRAAVTAALPAGPPAPIAQVGAEPGVEAGDG
jgi:hypothetical protein